MTTAPATTSAHHLDPSRRQDFVLLFDVTDGNPNGDPDAGNLPRVDPETMHGLVTDVSLKRKVRDWVDAAQGNEERFKIYVQSGEALNTKHERAYAALGIRSTGTKQNREEVEQARDWMCANFYDIRVFGAVMSTGRNCGQVRGPVQLTFARSLDPVVPLDISITRVAVTRAEDMLVVEGDDGEDAKGGKQREMGRKSLISYGLYKAYGFYNPHFAERSGSDGEDLALLWKALQMMWDLDRSSSRGLMVCRGLYVFSHESSLGDAPAQQLFDRISVGRRADADVPRAFSDYEVIIEDSDLPAAVSFTRLVG